MANVWWYKPHPHRHSPNHPIEIFIHDLFEPFGPSTFIPLARIKSACVVCPIKLETETVLTVCPIKKKVYI